MKITDEQRRVLDFVETANRGGHRPSRHEIDQWRKWPDAKPARRGELLEPAVESIPDRYVTDGPASLKAAMLGTQYRPNLGGAVDFARLWNMPDGVGSALTALALGATRKRIPGRPGRPAVYAPDVPAEKFVTSLRRLGWLERDEKKTYAVTRLGIALLRAATDDEHDVAAVVILDTQDGLAYGDLLGTIAESGDCLVVDPYLKVGQMKDLIQHTSARRFLVGSGLSTGELARMGILIQTAPANYPQRAGVAFELRQSPDLHDRWIIGDSDVYVLGISMNGVGKKPSTLVQFPYRQGEEVRGLAEKAWDNAIALAQGQRSGIAAVRLEEGLYRHGTCAVRHRTVEAASRCRNP